MQRKQFSWKRWQSGKYDLQTRDGRKVRDAQENTSDAWPVRAEVERKDGFWDICTFNAEGIYNPPAGLGGLDLLLVRKGQKLYANIYVDGKTFFHPTEKQAKRAAQGSSGCFAVARKVFVPSGYEVKVQR